MGKGNCLLGFATMGVGAIRGAIGCLCCLVFTGPIFFLVGLIMLVGPNHYKEHVNQWNSDVANYTKETIPLLRQTGVTFQAGSTNYMLGLTNILVQPSSGGNTEDVTTNAKSYYFTTSVLGDLFNPGRNDLKVSVNSTAFSPAVQQSKSVSITSVANFQVGGTSSSSPSTTSKDYGIQTYTIRVKCDEDNQCSYNDIRRKCASQASQSLPNDESKISCDSTDMVYSGGYVSEGNHATCTFYTHIQYFCKPLKLQTLFHYMWVEDDTKSSCDYPFKAQKRKCSSVSPAAASSSEKDVPFTFMASNDPHITLSAITQGSMNFGLTAVAQRLTGVAMMVIGCLMLACLIGMCVAMRDLFCGRNHEHRGAVYGAFGRSYQYPSDYQRMNVQQNSYQQQPAYGGQPGPQPGQPGYGQQQQQGMYGQQQQQNAQPPSPGYGQQQPQQDAWGQPLKPQQQGPYGAV